MDKLNEQLAAKIVGQIATALHYLHTKNIVHRDVKPENILLDSNYSAKLTDFGLACTVLGPLYRVCGTPTYVAPEVLAQLGYGFEIDVWSLGILLHVLLVGYPPFRNPNRANLFKMIIKANLNLNQSIYEHVSKEAKRLISEILTPLVDRRLKAVEVVNHPWTQKYNLEFHYSRI
uniref:Aurora kinase n=1 Tax=Acrobeloides nanus TaxID=290746 RepID=A0A914EMF4_9BILA